MNIRDLYDVIVIGSGPGGLAAAIAARKNGAEHVLIVDRDTRPGGILQQCIHNGFGLQVFKKDLPGPSYAQHYINEANDLKIEMLSDAIVLDINDKKEVYAAGGQIGRVCLRGKALVLAMGCRERTRAQIGLAGTRPAGVFTAGTAQRWVNVEGYMPGRRFVILGSGDIGMIMARRLTYEGAKVESVLEVMPYLTGLTRNYVQCLLDNDIPLHLSQTISRIYGHNRVEAVETCRVDENRRPIPGSAETIACDTLLLSVGLIPENELSRKAGLQMDCTIGGPRVDDRFATSVPGIFAAGNVVQVYDLVDWVTEAGLVAGKYAALYANGVQKDGGKRIPIQAAENVRYVVPQEMNTASLGEGEVRLQFRVSAPIEKPVWVEVRSAGQVLARKGEPYARPGEMITVTLTEKHLDDVSRSRGLSVAVVER